MRAAEHPGRILRDQLRGRSVAELAFEIGISPTVLAKILDEKAPITLEISKRLAETFGTTPEFWNRMQAQYDQWRENESGR
jgi:addiction module HigA family antidote